MEDFRQPEDIKTVLYTCLFVLSFLGFIVCCLFLIHKRAECEEREKHNKVSSIEI